MFQRAGSRFRDRLGKPGRAAIGNHNRRSARGMRGANDGAQIVRIFHAIQHHQQLRVDRNFIQLSVALGRAERQHSLVRGAIRSPVERLSGLKPHRHRLLSRQIDDLLQARTTRPASNQNPIKTSPRP